MSKLMSIDMEFLQQKLEQLLKTPSPTGFSQQAQQMLLGCLHTLDVSAQPTRKGGIMATLGENMHQPARALCAHFDTLGAMVKEIKANGRLRMSKLGSYAWNTVEGETCLIHSSSQVFSGTILPVKASAHIYGEEVNTMEREDETMELRIDMQVETASEVMELGIDIGDFISFDARVYLHPQGFIRSRHLDDKAGVACILAALQSLQINKINPAGRTYIHFSAFEEVGHGAAEPFPGEVDDLVSVDMAVVGEGQNSDEYHTTICVKDSGGPYHSGLSERLTMLAKKANIPFKRDIYPRYSSDGTAFWRAGGSARVALIGPGVDASHSYERTHSKALEATTRLILAYLTSPDPR